MFKIPLLQNKESLITIAAIIGLLFLLVINLTSLLPQVLEVYSPMEATQNTSPIDAASVNKAIEFLEE